MKAWIYSRYGSPDVLELSNLLEAGEITPMIDKVYPFREAPEAFRHLDSGSAIC